MSPADSPFASLPAPGPHPATAELRAYAAGTLDAAAQHRIEAHALDCERCADVLAGLAMSDAATTNDAVAELRSRLHSRIGEARPVPAAGRRAWPRVAAAAVLLGAVGASLWGWERRPAPEAAPVATARPAAAAPRAPRPETAFSSATAAAAISTAPAAPAAMPAADYAAATAAGAGRARSRAPRPARAPAIAQARADEDRNATADTESQPDAMTAAATAAPAEAVAAAPADQEPDRPAPAAASPAALSEVVVASRRAKKMVSQEAGTPAMADQAAPDSAAGSGRTALAGRLTKSKAAAPSAARVVATPMPAAPALAPAPVGGTRALREYLRREAAAFEPDPNARRLTGTVRLRLLVEADGRLTELKVTRGLRPDYDAEALRLVSEGPAWQPGVAVGRRTALPVKVVVPF